MKNRNVYASSGTLSGSPVTVRANFMPEEWMVTNRSENRLVLSFGPDSDIAIPAGQGVRLEIARQECTVNGTGDYEIEASEILGSLDMA